MYIRVGHILSSDKNLPVVGDQLIPHRGLKTTNFYEFAEVEISIVASAAVRLQSDSLTTVGKQLLSSK